MQHEATADGRARRLAAGAGSVLESALWPGGEEDRHAIDEDEWLAALSTLRQNAMR